MVDNFDCLKNFINVILIIEQETLSGPLIISLKVFFQKLFANYMSHDKFQVWLTITFGIATFVKHIPVYFLCCNVAILTIHTIKTLHKCYEFSRI